MAKSDGDGGEKPPARLGVREIARRVGLAPMTVSRVLSKPDIVSPATRAKVLEAIADYAASCALSATLPNAIYQEAVRAYFTGWYTEIVADLPTVVAGRVSPLYGAGLGLKLRDELFTRADATVRRTGI